jgi:hypothetical protein
VHVKSRFSFKRYFYVAGYAMAQLVQALRYKSEGRGFDSRWCYNAYDRTMVLRLTQSLTVMSTRNISCGIKAAGA